MNFYPNILIIAGSGRNVGKTSFATQLISYLTKTQEVYAVKISPHFHTAEPKEKILVENKDYIICHETEISHKDSSLMLQAGASKVFYMQCYPYALSDGFNQLSQYLPQNKTIIIESGGLYNIIEPGVLVFIKGGDKKNTLDYRNVKNIYEIHSQDIFIPTSTNQNQAIKFLETFTYAFNAWSRL